MSENSSVILDTHYLPCIEYFYLLLKYDKVYIEAYETFQKQTFRNRCEILGANKVDILTVPVLKTGQKVLIREIEIDYSQKWLGIHWRALESAYRNSPYFEYYSPYFQDVFEKRHKYLFDLNLELMTLCLKLLRIEKEICLSVEWKKQYEGKMLDLRSKIQPNSSNSSLIESWVSYRQVFGNNFVKNLSILDLLFNEGPDSIVVLNRLKTTIEQ